MVAESKEAADSLLATEWSCKKNPPPLGRVLANIEWVEPMERLLAPKKGSPDEWELQMHPWLQNKENLTIEFDFSVHFDSTTGF